MSHRCISAALALLSALFPLIALAQAPSPDRRCDAPPFGATAAEFAGAQAEFRAIAVSMEVDIRKRDGSSKSVEWYLKNAVGGSLRKACYAKLDNSAAAREDFRASGIDDAQLQTLSIITIAVRYFHGMGYPVNPQTEVRCNLKDNLLHPVWATYTECERLVTAERQKQAEILEPTERAPTSHHTNPAAEPGRGVGWREIAVIPSTEAGFGDSRVYISEVHEQSLPGNGGRQIRVHLLANANGADSLDVVEVIWCETQTSKMLEARLPNGVTTYPSGGFSAIDRTYDVPTWEAFKALCR